MEQRISTLTTWSGTSNHRVSCQLGSASTNQILLRTRESRAHHFLLVLVQLRHVSEEIIRVVDFASLLTQLACEIITAKLVVLIKSPHATCLR